MGRGVSTIGESQLRDIMTKLGDNLNDDEFEQLLKKYRVYEEQKSSRKPESPSHSSRRSQSARPADEGPPIVWKPWVEFLFSSPLDQLAEKPPSPKDGLT